MTQLSLITLSKGRLHHVRQTLPLMMAQDADEVIVVDYGCPDGTADWVEANHPGAKVVRVSDDAGFCPARARNLGAGAAKGDWLVFIDADVKPEEGWLGWIRENLAPGRFYRAGRTAETRPLSVAGKDPETVGTFICARSDFETVGGFDEVFRDWGGEDWDIFIRLTESGAVASEYPAGFVSAIPHGDSERAMSREMPDKAQRILLDGCYIEAKLKFARALGQSGELPLEMRENLRAYIFERLKNWFEKGANEPLALNFTMMKTQHWAPPPYRKESELKFTIRLTS